MTGLVKPEPIKVSTVLSSWIRGLDSDFCDLEH